MVHEPGQGLVEYSVLVAAIAIVLIGILTLLGYRVSDLYDPITQAFP